METNRRSFLKSAGVAGTGLLAAGTTAVKGEGSPPTAGQHDSLQADFMTERFLDNLMIEVTPGVSRRLHPAIKHPLNPVVQCKRWCDGDYIQPYTTMYDEEDKLFKMWARAGSWREEGRLDGNAAYMLYFTSSDGVHWERPDLGIVEVAGRRDQNIVLTSDLALKSVAARAYGPEKYVIPTRPRKPQGKKAFFWSVNKHPHPRDESEKFIAAAIVQDLRRGAHLVTSPDGIHWACASTPFWQTPHDVSGTGDDCLMHLTYNKAKQNWTLYRRIIPEFSEQMIATDDDRERTRVKRYYRSYALAESEDLLNWTSHQFILAMDPDDPPDTELYQFATHQFGDIDVGYMSVFYLRSPQAIDIQLATSRDGIHFTRVCRGEAFVPSGPLGYYDFMAMGCSQPKPIMVEDTVYLYYAALNYPHDAERSHTDPSHYKGGAALATFKRDRFASLETSSVDSGPCHVITKPFTIQHPYLSLNAATWMKGSIRVEALTRDWQPIPGFTQKQSQEIQGDALNHPVHWNSNSDLSRLTGQEIRLKFHMTRARLHAMTLSNKERPLGAVESEYQFDKDGDSSPRDI